MFLTEKQLAVLNFIRDFIRDRGIAPTLDEMAQYFGVSRITVHEHVNALEKKGALTKARNMARAITLVEPRAPAAPRTLPIKGRIAAGAAIEAVELGETFALDDLAAPGGNTYMLQVEGDSMIDAHICSGDLVIVAPSAAPDDGDIVVAMLPDEATGGLKATLKRFFREGERVRLQPENAALAPIWTTDVQVQGKVVAVVRPSV
jgi:repressor LexA